MEEQNTVDQEIGKDGVERRLSMLIQQVWLDVHLSVWP